jgi:hypothetical protein
MMSADEVADVVMFALTRPRRLRILTASFRPMSEPSWGELGSRARLGLLGRLLLG